MVKELQICYWKTIFPELKYKQYQVFPYSKRKRNLIIDNILSHGYNIMIREFTEQLVIYIDKGRFGQS
jgi:hypothetical protein